MELAGLVGERRDRELGPDASHWPDKGTAADIRVMADVRAVPDVRAVARRRLRTCRGPDVGAVQYV